MNTTTTTATTTAATAATAAPTAKAATSTLAASARFKTFALTFSTFGPVVYCVTQFFNWPLFTFHPATNRLAWGYEGPRPGEGPNMLWYGWTATTLLVAAVVGIIAMMLPEHISKKVPLALIWLLPILAIPYIAYSLMPWWIH
ncbi:MAG TPA: hypothetical protein VGN55_12875 [Xanthobacteraceae bacterium]|jgi:hypothetical protein